MKRRQYLAVFITLMIAAIVTSFGWVQFGHALSTEIAQTRDRNRVIFMPGICSTGPVGTETQPDTFWEMYRWFVDDLGYQTLNESASSVDIFGFSYATTDTTEIDPRTIDYHANTTKASIVDVHAPRLAAMVSVLANRYPNERFDIVAHSMGGVVALYAAATFPEMIDSIRSILTINSPVQGIRGVREFFSTVPLPCLSLGENPPALDDLDNDGAAIEAIRDNTDWSSTSYDSIFVATIANECDTIVTTLNLYPGADLGTLSNADYALTFVADPDGDCSLADQFSNYPHRAPLLVNSNSAASPTIDAILTSLLTNWKLPAAFLSPNARQVVQPEIPVLAPMVLTKAFIGNQDASTTPVLSSAMRNQFRPQTLTRAFAGNVSERLHSGLDQPSVDSKPLARAFIGNDNDRIDPQLSVAPVVPQDLRLAFMGNQDSGIHPALSSAPIDQMVLTSAFMGNHDAGITPQLIVPEFAAIDIRCIYDANSNGATERDEAVAAVTDFLLSSTDITRQETIEVVTSFLLSQSFKC